MISDRVTEVYFKTICSSETQTKLRDRIHWMCQQTVGSRVLDVGCSQGIASLLLAREGFQVVGCDTDAAALDYAKELQSKESVDVAKRIVFVQESVFSHTPVTGGYDTIIAGEILEHFANARLFGEKLHALLKPEGTLVLTIPFGLHPHDDHKQSLFFSDLLVFFGDRFAMTHLSVTDGYIRCVAKKNEQPMPPSPDLLLSLTEKHLFDWQTKYYALHAKHVELNANHIEMKTVLANLRGTAEQQVAELFRQEQMIASLEKEKSRWIDDRQDQKMEKDRLILEIERLVDEKRLLAEKIESLVADQAGRVEEKRFLTEKMETLADERRSLVDEKRLLAEKIERLVADQAGRVEEKRFLTEKIESLVADQAGRAEEKRFLTEKMEALATKHKRLLKEKQLAETETEKQLAQLAEKNQSLTAERTKLQSELDAQKEARQKGSSQNRLLDNEVQRALDTRKTQSLTIKRLTRDKESVEHRLADFQMKQRQSLASFQREKAEWKKEREILRKERLALTRELKQAHGKLCTVIRHRESLAQSFSFQIVSTAVRAVAKPGLKTLLLPFQLGKTIGKRLIFGKRHINVTVPPSPEILAVVADSMAAEKKNVILRVSAAEAKAVPGAEKFDNVSASQWKPAAPAIVPLPTRSGLTAEELPSEGLEKGFSISSLRKNDGTSPVLISILDEFTSECLKYDVTLISPGLERWKELMDYRKPDFFFMESCWRGNGNRWGNLTYKGANRPKLEEFLKLCKKRGIPTVMWNKEDPPHFDRFLQVAQQFDYVFTSDALCVPKYKQAGVNAVPMTFAAQPYHHNPLPAIFRLPKAVFAGTYYSYRPERCEDFCHVIDMVEAAGLDYDIFDRCANYDPIARVKFTFPDRYSSKIAGNLPPDEMWKVHKGYRFQINMNTVKHSPTMYARRVFESLASGTPVISNSSLGMTQMFGDIVLSHGDGADAAERLRHLISDEKAYDETVVRGVRAVMRDHTYNHRIKFIADVIGLPLIHEFNTVNLFVRTGSETETRDVLKRFKSQTCPSVRMLVFMEDFEGSETLLHEAPQSVLMTTSAQGDTKTALKRFFPGEEVIEATPRDLRNKEFAENVLYGLKNPQGDLATVNVDKNVQIFQRHAG